MMAGKSAYPSILTQGRRRSGSRWRCLARESSRSPSEGVLDCCEEAACRCFVGVVFGVRNCVRHLGLDVPQAWVQGREDDDQNEDQTQSDEQEPYPPSLPDPDERADDTRERSSRSHRGLEDAVRERPCQEEGERRCRAADEAAYREHPPLDVMGHLALPDRLAEAADERAEPREDEASHGDQHHVRPHCAQQEEGGLEQEEEQNAVHP